MELSTILIDENYRLVEYSDNSPRKSSRKSPKKSSRKSPRKIKSESRKNEMKYINETKNLILIDDGYKLVNYQ